jgi:outer membrane lipoprotein-sorting protein
MRTTIVRLSVVAMLLLATAVPGNGAPAGPTWVGDAQAVREYQEAAGAFGAATSYKSRMTGTAQGGTFEMMMEWVKPNRLRMSFTRPEPGAFIFIDDARWSTSPTRGCARIPAGMRVPTVETPDKPLDGTITVTRVGNQTIDGVATNVFDAVTVSSSGQAKKRVFIDPATKTFKRWEVESAEGRLNIDYLEFNTNIRIEPPC